MHVNEGKRKCENSFKVTLKAKIATAAARARKKIEIQYKSITSTCVERCHIWL